MMKNKFVLVVFVFLVSMICFGQNTYKYSQPKKLDDGWKTNNLHSLKIDTELVYRLFNQLNTRKSKVHSVLLVKDNEIVIEEYLNGHSSSMNHDLRSVTKSIRSILMGIAIDKGFIASVDDPIFEYLKTHKPSKNIDKRKNEITIRHLLTMSSGLDCNDWDKNSLGQEDRVHRKKDWVQHTIDLPMINNPSEVSNYCSMGTILIAEIISQASGMEIDEFAQQYLFNPLGITNASWNHTSSKKVIPSAKRLYMTTRDMAKIGQLVLDNGKWNKKQVVSENWINEATSIKTNISGVDYGYLWWNIPFKGLVSKVATGNGGQYIFVFPELDMVAVFTGGAYNSEEDKLPFAIVSDIFLPIFAKQQHK